MVDNSGGLVAAGSVANMLTLETAEDRIIFDYFLERVVFEDDCWPWNGYANKVTGYGTVHVGGQNLLAHRVSWELFRGPIPKDMQIDHLCHGADPDCPGRKCRHRLCVNPAHLEVVTSAENTRRGLLHTKYRRRPTHCKYGHEFTEENTSFDARGRRMCKTCLVRRPRARYLGVPYTGEDVPLPERPRNTHCPNGHEYTPENTYTTPSGWQRCKTCTLAHNKAWRVRQRESK